MTEAASRPPRSRIGQLVINVCSNFGYYAVGGVVMFVLSPYLNNHLGRSAYNVWTFFVSITLYLSMADAGMNAATVKFVAHHLARGDADGLRRTMASSLRFFGGVALVLAALAVAIVLLPLGWFNVPIEPDLARTVLALLVLNYVAEMAFAAFQAALLGAQRYEVARGASIVARLVKFAAILYFVGQGFGLVALALLTVGEVVLRGSLQLALLRRKVPEVPVTLSGADRETFRTIFRYTAWIIVSTVAYKLVMLTSVPIAGLAIDKDAVVVVDKAITPIITLEQLLWALSQVFVPFAAARAAEADVTALKQSILRGSRLTLLMALPPLTYLFLVGRGFVGAWMFEKTQFPIADVHAAHTFVLIMAPAFILLFIQQTPLAVLVGMGKVRVPALINLGQGVVSVGLSYTLGRAYGLNGLAVGCALPMVVVNVFLLPWYVTSALDIRWRNLLAEAVWPGLKVAVVAAPLVYLLVVLVDANGEHLWRMRYQIPIAMAVAAAFFAVSWFLGLDSTDRDWVRAKLRRRQAD